MSAVTNPAVAQTATTTPTPATTSTWHTIGNGIKNGAKAVGRSVVWFFSKIGEYAVKAWNWAKRFFAPAGRFIAKQFVTMKDFIVEHKQGAILLSAGIAIGAIIYGVSSALCCKGSSQCKTDSKKEPENQTSKA